MKYIGITLGDAADIGPEIVRAALRSGSLPDGANYEIIGDYPKCSLGQPTAETARAAAAALEEAAGLAQTGRIDAVVTGPIHKARMYEIDFEFPGQTEFFADRCGVKNFAMLLTGGEITVALVTAHLPLSQVASSLTTEEIVRVGSVPEENFEGAIILDRQLPRENMEGYPVIDRDSLEEFLKNVKQISPSQLPPGAASLP